MTPVPRVSPEDGPPSAFGLLVGQLATLQESVTSGFRDLAHEIAKLRDETVTQREYDRFTSEFRIDWAEAMLKHDKDIRELREEHATQAARADRNRKWLWTTAIAAIAALGGAIGAISTVISVVSHLH